MRGTLLIPLLALALARTVAVDSVGHENAESFGGNEQPADAVDPFWANERTSLPLRRGAAARWFWPKGLAGNTHPGASWPHELVSVVAYSGAYPTGYGTQTVASRGAPASLREANYTDASDAASFAQLPYQKAAYGLANMQPSGTGMIQQYMNLLLTYPLVNGGGGDDDDSKSSGAPSRTLHALVAENAKPGLYQAVLGESDVLAEATVSPGLAVHRYSSVPSSPALQRVAVELSSAGLEVPSLRQALPCISAELRDGNAVHGSVCLPPPVGGVASDSEGSMYFAIVCVSATCTSDAFWPSDVAGFKRIDVDAKRIAQLGGRVGITFSQQESSALAPIELRIGFCLQSPQCAADRAAASASSTFEEVADAAWRAWNDALSAVEILDDASAPGALRERRLFYTCLYHALKKPVDLTGVVPDAWTANGKGYAADFSTLWDQYKTTLPLVLTFYPSTAQHILEGLAALQERFGFFPTAYTLDKGFQRFASQAIALAHHTLADGLARGYSMDWEAVLASMLKTFEDTPEGRNFTHHGSTPPLLTHTLDLAGAAAAAAQVALHVHNESLASSLLALAENARNAFDSHTCVLRNDSQSVYYEGTYMTYSFRLLPDMESRIALCGSEDRFVKLLDNFFGMGKDEESPFASARFVRSLPIVPVPTDPPAWVGKRIARGYAEHSFEGLDNEPDMETPYAYAYAKQASKLADLLRAIKTFSFSPGPGGEAGNDDSGGMSAWFVWASLGLFPVAGQPVVLIGVPSFENVTLRVVSLEPLSASSPPALLRVTRTGRGRYVQRATLNGHDLSGRAWLWTKEVHRGGVLVIEMGLLPSSEWGMQEAPPSFKDIDDLKRGAV